MTPSALAHKKIFLSGHQGMLGSAISRLCQERNYENVLQVPKSSLNLLDAQAVNAYFQVTRPEMVIMAAARVGGILANMTRPGDFITENLKIQTNMIEACLKYNVEKVVFIGSSCIYPKLAKCPIPEEALLTGPLEPTNDAYAIAKIAGIKMLQAYERQHGLKSVSLMFCNLYGTNDHYDLNSCHVLSAIIRRVTEAKVEGKDSITLWGTGEPLREFLHVDDAARAVLYFMGQENTPHPLNIGWGEEISIKDLSHLIAKHAGYTGKILFNPEKPNGMMRKCMDVTRMKELGFTPQISLDVGIKQTLKEYENMYEEQRALC